jgi:hypothetical protein
VKAKTIPLLGVLALLAGPVIAEGVVVPRADVELDANRGTFEFGGTGPAISLGNSGILDFSGTSFAVQAWVKVVSACNDTGADSGPPCDMSIVDRMASVESVNNHGWRLLKQSDGHFWFCLGGGPDNGCDGGLSTTVISHTAAATGVWYHVVAVKTSRRISIYVNGVLDGTSILGGYFDATDLPVLVGANAIEGAYLIGNIGQVQLFRCALSGSQVQALYESTKSRYAY